MDYNELDINNKDSIREYFPNDKEGTEMFECVQSVPPRFREDAVDLFFDPDNRELWDMKTIDKAWSYFLDDIMMEMTEEEMEIYGFG